MLNDLPAWVVVIGVLLGWGGALMFVTAVVGWNVAKWQIKRERKRSDANR